jgi:hypothetical protein
MHHQFSNLLNAGNLLIKEDFAADPCEEVTFNLGIQSPYL